MFVRSAFPTLLLLGFAACSQPERNDEAAADKSTATPANDTSTADTRWIEGAWIMEGEYCAGSSAVQLRKGGEYVYEYDDPGTWQFDGTTLSVTADGETYDNEVKQTGPNEMVMGGNRFRRCLPDGGEEPWHPGEAYSTK